MYTSLGKYNKSIRGIHEGVEMNRLIAMLVIICVTSGLLPASLAVAGTPAEPQGPDVNEEAGLMGNTWELYYINRDEE